MYCKKCGKELSAGENYCSQCGTKTGNTTISLNLDGLSTVRKRINRMKDTDGLKWYASSLAFLLLDLLIIGTAMFEASYTIFLTKSVEVTLFEKSEALKVLFMLGYLVSIVLILYPVLFNRDLKGIYFNAGMLMSILSLVLFAAMYFSVKELVLTGEYAQLTEYVNFSIKLTENAWLFLVSEVLACICTYTARFECEYKTI